MSTSRLAVAATLAWCFIPLVSYAQAPEGPSDHAVLLPPQTLDTPVKAPNTTRDKHGEWTIYGGVYLVQPVFGGNPAYVLGAAGGNIARQVDFSHNLEVSPQIWLGYVSERGWGVRGRWFQFDHDSTTNYTTLPGETVRGASPLPLGQAAIGGQVFAASNLAFDVGDFQATYSCDTAKWSLLAAFGVRYTHMSQDYRTTLVSPATRIDLVSGHNINAAGPSFSLETKRRFGESPFSVYGNLHGAIVFGRTNETYTALNNGIYQELTRGQTDVLPIGELEIGGEYSCNLGRARFFFQTGFVGQVWWNGGSASNIDPIGPTSTSHTNFGFLGLSLRTGLRY